MGMEPVLTPEMIRAAAPNAELPTPPGEREVALLQRVLDWSDVDGVEQLRAQIRGLLVAPLSDATARIYLHHADMPRAPFSAEGRSKLPGSVLVRSPQGHLIGHLSVWVDGGLLRALQFVRHDAQPALTLPPPEWLELPASAPTPSTPEPSVATRAPRRRRMRWLVAVAALVLVAAIAATALLVARAGGADVDVARRAGAQAGTAAGLADGSIFGAFAGANEGQLAGHMSTYAAARTRALAVARRDAQRQEAAANAALYAQYPNPTTCVGYQTPQHTWVCA
jgi:hypothetical protein